MSAPQGFFDPSQYPGYPDPFGYHGYPDLARLADSSHYCDLAQFHEGLIPQQQLIPGHLPVNNPGPPPGFGGQWNPLARTFGGVPAGGQPASNGPNMPPGFGNFAQGPRRSSVSGSVPPFMPPYTMPSQNSFPIPNPPPGLGGLQSQQHSRSISMGGEMDQFGNCGAMRPPPGFENSLQTRPGAPGDSDGSHARHIPTSIAMGDQDPDASAGRSQVKDRQLRHTPTSISIDDPDTDPSVGRPQATGRVAPPVRKSLHSARLLQLRQKVPGAEEMKGDYSTTPWRRLTAEPSTPTPSVPAWRRTAVPLQFGDMPTQAGPPGLNLPPAGATMTLEQQNNYAVDNWTDRSLSSHGDGLQQQVETGKAVPQTGPSRLTQAELIEAQKTQRRLAEAWGELSVNGRNPNHSSSVVGSSRDFMPSTGTATTATRKPTTQTDSRLRMSPNTQDRFFAEMEVAREKDRHLREKDSSLIEIDMRNHNSYLYPNQPSKTDPLLSNEGNLKDFDVYSFFDAVEAKEEALLQDEPETQQPLHSPEGDFPAPSVAENWNSKALHGSMRNCNNLWGDADSITNSDGASYSRPSTPASPTPKGDKSGSARRQFLMAKQSPEQFDPQQEAFSKKISQMAIGRRNLDLQSSSGPSRSDFGPPKPALSGSSRFGPFRNEGNGSTFQQDGGSSSRKVTNRNLATGQRGLSKLSRPGASQMRKHESELAHQIDMLPESSPGNYRDGIMKAEDNAEQTAARYCGDYASRNDLRVTSSDQANVFSKPSTQDTTDTGAFRPGNRIDTSGSIGDASRNGRRTKLSVPAYVFNTPTPCSWASRPGNRTDNPGIIGNASRKGKEVEPSDPAYFNKASAQDTTGAGVVRRGNLTDNSGRIAGNPSAVRVPTSVGGAETATPHSSAPAKATVQLLKQVATPVPAVGGPAAIQHSTPSVYTGLSSGPVSIAPTRIPGFFNKSESGQPLHAAPPVSSAQSDAPVDARAAPFEPAQKRALVYAATGNPKFMKGNNPDSILTSQRETMRFLNMLKVPGYHHRLPMSVDGQVHIFEGDLPPLGLPPLAPTWDYSLYEKPPRAIPWGALTCPRGEDVEAGGVSKLYGPEYEYLDGIVWDASLGCSRFETDAERTARRGPMWWETGAAKEMAEDDDEDLSNADGRIARASR